MSFTSDRIFKKIQKALKTTNLQVGGIFEFQLKNKGGALKKWQIDFGEKKVTSASSFKQKSDCIFSLSDKNCTDLMTGKVDATELFFSGDIKIEGEMSLAMKLADLKDHLTSIPDEEESGSGDKVSSGDKSSSSGSVTLDGFKSSIVFDKMYQLVKDAGEDAFKDEDLSGVFEFSLKNAGGKSQSWVIDLNSKKVLLKPQQTSVAADVVLTMSDDNCEKVMSGAVDPTELFFGGDLKIEGEMGLAMKLGGLTEKLKNFKPKKKSPSSSGSGAASADDLTVEGFSSSKIFSEMAAGLAANPSLKKEINGIYQFKLKNTNGKSQSWTADLKSGKIYKGPCKGGAECVLEMSDKNCMAVMSGEIDPTDLFFSGELKIEGDMGLAMKLSQLKFPRSKL